MSINKILVQQQLIKNEKMKRRVASSQAEKESITEKMAKLDSQDKSKDDDKEKDEEKPGTDSSSKKNRQLKLMIAALTLLNMNSISDYFYYSVFMESLSYETFVKELLEKRQIARIVMNKYTLSHHHMYEAEVVDSDGSSHLLPVGNADNFLESLE